MPLEVQLIRAREFIRVGPQGHIDLDQSRAILDKLCAACRRRSVRRALLDLRDVRSDFGPEELSELIRMFKEFGLPHVERLALLHSGDPQRRVRTLAMIASMRGWAVRAFPRFESAFEWLALSDSVDDQKPLVTSAKAAGDIRKLQLRHEYPAHSRPPRSRHRGH